MATVTLQEAMDDPSKLDLLDAEQHEALMREIEGVGAPEADAAAATDDSKADPASTDAKDEPKVEPKVEAPAAKTEESKPSGILAPDGKSTIPYSVLQSEREARRAAERATESMGVQLAEMQERIKTLEAGGSPKSEGELDDLRAEITAMAEEAPALAPLHTKMVDKLDALEKRLESREAADAETEAQAKQRIAAEVQQHIDNNPALRLWDAERGPLWEEAKSFDAHLRTLPQWQGKPLAERFEHVVKLMVASHDDSILPEGMKTPAAPPPTAPVADPAAKVAATIKAAEAKLAKVTPAVTTLSDLPAGAAPEQSEQEKLENISVVQLAAQFEKLTPAQQQAYLQSVQI